MRPVHREEIRKPVYEHAEVRAGSIAPFLCKRGVVMRAAPTLATSPEPKGGSPTIMSVRETRSVLESEARECEGW